MRIYELSKRINISNKEIIAKLADLNIIVKSPLSNIDDDTANELANIFNRNAHEKNEAIDLKYTKHFGLKKLPFENVPDPHFFFDQGDYARIHNRLKESLKVGRGLMVVTGPIGSGKTTLSQMLIAEFAKQFRLIWMAEPSGSSTDLFLIIARELGLKPQRSERTFVLRDIREILLRIKNKGSRCLLIVDEAHLLSDDTMNGIRLLNNLEEGAAKLIQILLLGQEEILELINKPEMEAFKQRIANLEIIGKMNSDKISEYVAYRIQVAGAEPSIFSSTGQEALELAFSSGGTPRLINSLCDRSLDISAEKQKSSVDAQDIYEASKGMGLSSEIFHYIVALKTKEQKKIVPSHIDNDFIRESKELANKVQKKAVTESFLPKKDKNNLKKPIIFFLLSIIILLLSLYFYCQRSSSTELMTCLRNLIGH